MPQSGRPGASSGYCQSLDGIAPITQLPAGIIMQRALMVLSCIIGGVFMFIALGATDTFDMSKFVFDQCVLSFRVLNAFFLLYSSAPILRNTAVHISL